MTKTFPNPPHAGHHCRHYDYKLGLEGGPSCAVGIDLTKPGSSKRCWPLKPAALSECDKREEHTEEERAASREAQHARTFRTFGAIAALPAPIPLNTSGTVPCPNCDGGTLSYSRWHRGAAISCDTENCCSSRMSIAAGVDWPVPGLENMEGDGDGKA